MSFKLAEVSVQYAKNKELRQEDVTMLQDWIQKQPHLPNISELQVIFFLHSCYYSIEKAKTTIDNYFTVRTHCPEFFAARNPTSPSVTKLLDIALHTTLPELTPEGYSIIFMKLVDSDTNKYVFTEQLKGFDMSSIMELNKRGTASGQIILTDMDGIVFGHMTKLGLMPMKKFMYYLQEAMPFRLMGLHFINVVPFMDKILALMRPFMKKELMDVLYLHTTLDSLYKHVPQECLPSNYGGTADSLEVLHEKMKQDLASGAEYFAEEEKQIVDETKRPGKPKNAGDIFGVEGSFKKLDID